MPAIVRLSVKEANELADIIEQSGSNPDSIRAVIAGVGNPRNGRSSVPATDISDEEYLVEKRGQTEIEYGTDLECMICHEKFDHLEKILIEFDETEQEKIRPKLGNYTTGYLGLSLGLKYG